MNGITYGFWFCLVLSRHTASTWIFGRFEREEVHSSAQVAMAQFIGTQQRTIERSFTGKKTGRMAPAGHNEFVA